jgi:hypothetical protein
MLRLARHRARHCGFSTTTISVPGRLPLVQSSILRSEQTTARSLSRLPALASHPFTHRESVLVVSEAPPRQADPAPAPRAFRLASPRREDASTQRLQPTYDTSTLRIARRSNHPRHRLSSWSGLPRGPPGRNLGGAHDRVEPRLTASLQLRQRSSMALGLPTPAKRTDSDTL